MQRTVLANIPKSHGLVVFDVGANQGDWTVPFLEECGVSGRSNVALHCFEPVSSTIEKLRKATQKPEWRRQISYLECALSDHVGTAAMAIVGDGAGTNSLSPDPQGRYSRQETVALTTVDEYCRSANIEQIDLLKIDAEGHDLSVLRGASGMMARQSIRVIQFEYNHCWVWSHALLFDAFAIAEQTAYRIGKVTPRGIEVYQRWHPELEKFVEGNYLLCTEEWLQKFPTFSWWNT